jgi:hypothetical protein
VPSRLIIERHDPSVWDFVWKHILILKPVDIDLFLIGFVLGLSGPCPVGICSQAVDSNYAKA